jgi:hypothetical protein
MRTTVIAITLTALALSFPACGDESAASDADADTDTGTDTGTGGGWACPVATGAPCTGDAYAPGASASSLGEGYGFVAAKDRGVLLATRPDGSGGREPVLVVGEWCATPIGEACDFGLVTLAEPPDGPLTAIGLVSDPCPYEGGYGFLDRDSVLGHPAMILLCSPDECALFAMVVDEPVSARLEPVPGGVVPFGDARGLVRLASDEWSAAPGDPVCAFGDGLACFDGGEWTVVVEPGDTGVLLAAAAVMLDGEPGLVAVGESCRMLRVAAGEVVDVPLECATDLVSVDEQDGFLAAGGDGLLVLGFVDEMLLCPLGALPVALVRVDVAPSLGDGDRREATVFTTEGGVVEVWYQDGEACACSFQEPLDGRPLSWTKLAYMDAFGTMVITESSAYHRQEGGGFE